VLGLLVISGDVVALLVIAIPVESVLVKAVPAEGNKVLQESISGLCHWGPNAADINSQLQMHACDTQGSTPTAQRHV
jgi:hypothetical protein